MTILETDDVDLNLAIDDTDDIGALFEDIREEERLVLRIHYPGFLITYTREGWTASPIWLHHDAERIEAPTARELAAKVDEFLHKLQPASPDQEPSTGLRQVPPRHRKRRAVASGSTTHHQHPRHGLGDGRPQGRRGPWGRPGLPRSATGPRPK